MDAACVGDRAKKEEAKIVDPLLKETLWIDTYPESLERWIKDFAKGKYELTGEYEVNSTSTLYRFELNEDYREGVLLGSSHFHNVLITKYSEKIEVKSNV